MNVVLKKEPRKGTVHFLPGHNLLMQCVVQNMVKISVENQYGKYLCINT